MTKRNAKLLAAAALAAALLAGCGGGGGGGGGGVQPGTSQPQTISSVVDFITKLMAENGENSEPIDINSLTLVADDTVEPQALP